MNQELAEALEAFREAADKATQSSLEAYTKLAEVSGELTNTIKKIETYINTGDPDLKASIIRSNQRQL